MQTSAMMLDSQLSKILSSKPVESPIRLDTENMSKREDMDAQQSTSSEAEVKLVVRFIVEEHIVCNGKVERVKQLESEELSRIVSRVAWDGAKDENQTASLEDEKAGEDASEEHSTHKSNLTPRDSSSSDSLAKHSDKVPDTCADQTKNQDDEISNRNIQTSDHLPQPQLCMNAESSPEDNKNLQDQEKEKSVAQVENAMDIESTTTTDCDINSKLLSNHIYKTDDQCLESQSLVQDADKQIHCTVIDNDANFNTEPHIENGLSDQAYDDSRSVAETLNDCVNNVDLECQRAVQTTTVVENVDDLNQTHVADRDESVEISTGIETTNEIVLCSQNIMTADVDTNRDCTPNVDLPNSRSEKENSSHDIIRSNRDTLNEKLQSSLNESSTNERASFVDTKKNRIIENSAGKRIRRTNDQRSTASRASVSKLDDISCIRHSPASPRHMPHMSQSTSVNQYARQSKIFAKWSDNHFYPGTILRPARDRKYVINFFDGAQRNVAETDLIPLCNIQGKQVRVSIAKNYCVNAIVHNQRNAGNDQPMFDVEYQQDGLVRKCVPLKDIFLTGEQGTPLIEQPANSGASNFADVDLDNIIYEKRSRRLQDMEDYELTENSPILSKRKRGQYNMRNTTPRGKASNPSSEGPASPATINQKRHSQGDINHGQDAAESPDVLKTNFICPNSNPPSEGSSSTGSSNVPSVLELGQEFYFTNSSPHRTKTSLLL